MAKRKWLKRSGYTAVAMGLIALTAFAFAKTRGNANYEAALKEAHQAGIPLTVAEAEKLYQAVPNEENSAIEYASAIANSHDLATQKQLITEANNEKPTRQYTQQEIANAFHGFDAAFADIHLGNKKPRLWWRRDWNEGVNYYSKEVSSLSTLGEYMARRAEMRIKTSNLAGAWKDIIDLAKLSQRLDQIPDDRLTSLSLATKACNAACTATAYSPISDELLANLRSVSKELGEPRSLVDCTKIQAFALNVSFSHIHETSEMGREFGAPDFAGSMCSGAICEVDIRMPGMLPAVRAHALRSYIWVVNSYRSETLTYAQMAKLEDKFYDDRSDPLNGLADLTYKLVTVPPFQRWFSARALRSALETLIDALEVAHSHGLTSIAQLKSPLQLANSHEDPYTKKSVLAHRDRFGLAIYTTGLDMEDNNGNVSRIKRDFGNKDTGLLIPDLTYVPPPIDPRRDYDDLSVAKPKPKDVRD